MCTCSSFKLFLELEPQVRDIIFKFYESKYASCLKMLDEMKVRDLPALDGEGGPGRGRQVAVPDWVSSPGQPALGHVPGPPRQDPVHPDPQPRPHPGRCGGTKAKAGRYGWVWESREADALSALQYFSPYVSADMHKMAAAFNTTVAALEDELTQLILEGLINARIDSHSKVPGLGSRPWVREGAPETR